MESPGHVLVDDLRRSALLRGTMRLVVGEPRLLVDSGAGGHVRTVDRLGDGERLVALGLGLRARRLPDVPDCGPRNDDERADEQGSVSTLPAGWREESVYSWSAEELRGFHGVLLLRDVQAGAD